MAAFSIRLAKPAAKDLEALRDPLLRRVFSLLKSLEEDPLPKGAEKLSNRSEYRLRVGDYRVVYEVDQESKAVLVHRIRHRREVYRNL